MALPDATQPIAEPLCLPDLWIGLGLLALWLVLIAAVDPRGDFPIMDDWSFGRAVQTLVQQGRLAYDGWSTPTLFLQVLYGALFCLPLGFSFEVLRASTLLAGFAGLLAVYVLMREAGADRWTSTLGVGAAALSPQYFQHAFTFMTDVPFAALAVCSAVFFCRALRSGSSRDLAVATLISVCATLVRQIGIALPIAYAIAGLAISPRVPLRRVLAPAAATIGSLFAYNDVIEHLGLTSLLHDRVQASILAHYEHVGLAGIALEAIRSGMFQVCHVALLAVPLTCVLLAERLAQTAMSARAAVAVAVASLVLYLDLSAGYAASDFWVSAFGPIPVVILGEQGWGAADVPDWFRAAILGAELVAIVLTLMLFAAARPRGDGTSAQNPGDARITVFGLAAAGLMVAPFLASGDKFARYLVPIVPFLLLALFAAARTPARAQAHRGVAIARALAAFPIVLIASCSVALAHDSLLSNRLRWWAVDTLMREKAIAPERIDGGLAFNGWFLFERPGPLRERYAHFYSENRVSPWWRNEYGEYAVRFEESSAYTTAKQAELVWGRSYSGWLPGAAGSIVVERRSAPAVASPDGGR